MSLRELERHLVSSKHWTLGGEVVARERPENSLLEEGAIEFKVSGRAHDEGAVVGASGETQVLDVEARICAIIKKRAGLQLWDDVVPRSVADPVVPAAPALAEVLEEAAAGPPKKSLVEEYSGMHVTQTGAAVNVKETEGEALALWKELEAKLDAYCAM